MTDSGPNPAEEPPKGRSRLSEFGAAAQLLTRLPLLRSAIRHDDTAVAVWAFPLVGALIGALGGLVFFAANRAGVGIGSATFLAIGAQVLLTGALHEDGLADTADGFGGGRDREHKLAIMRDSRIGTYGVVALILAFGLRYAAVNELANSLISTSDEYDEAVSHISAVVLSLIAAGVVSRSAMAAAWYLLPPAREDGLAASAGAVPFSSTLVSVLLGAGLSFVILPAESWMAAMAVVTLTCGAMLLLARRQIGGHTGDVLGATQQVTEISALLAVTAVTVAI